MDSYTVYCREETFPSSQALLTIPVTDASQYSTKPLKWIRYIMAAVVGCKGELMTYTEDENGHEGHAHLPLNLEDAAPQHRKLCFIPEGPMNFVDVDGLNHLKSSQVTTPSRVGFRDNIVERDGSSVVTGLEQEFCDACHLIPHSKGNEVRLSFTHRSSTLTTCSTFKPFAFGGITHGKLTISPTFEMGFLWIPLFIVSSTCPNWVSYV